MNSTITHVKHLLEALQRFNPDAYLEPQLDVQGTAPQNLCVITSAGFHGKQELSDEIEDLEEKVEALEKKLWEVSEECEKESPDIKKIESLSQL